MRNIICLFALFAFLGCDNDNSKEPDIIICPIESTMVFALTVDYTTNEFLGGYTVDTPISGHTLTMACEYESPGDFGSVRWYDEQSGNDLFAGTIVWMGKGERTFPKKAYPPASFPKLDKTTAISPVALLHSEFDGSDNDADYALVWKAVANLQCVSWADSSTPAYFYLYRPSVGEGNPADWYWVIFLKY